MPSDAIKVRGTISSENAVQDEIFYKRIMRLLGKTRDGDNLLPEELKAVENAVNYYDERVKMNDIFDKYEI